MVETLHPLAYDVGTALAFLGSLAGLGVGHLVGDFVLQTDADAAAKAYPTNKQLAAGVHPWAGWPAALRHVASYLAAQATSLLIVLLVIPLTLPGVIAALAFSGATHAVIDRRRLVRAILAAKRCNRWPDASFWIDQSLHAVALLVAAVAGAHITSLIEVAVITGAGLLLIADALRIEYRHARRITAGPAATGRLQTPRRPSS